MAGGGPNRAAGVLYAAGFAVVVLVVLGIVAGVRQADDEGVAVLRCDPAAKEVFLAVDGNVLVLDERGDLKLTIRPKEPFVSVRDVDRTEDGRYLVAEGGRRRLHFVDQSGRITRTLDAPQLFTLQFEVVPVPGGRLLVADTIGHMLRLIDESGTVFRETEAGYPNAVGRWGNGYVVFVTFESRARLYDADLKPLTPARGDAIATLVAGGHTPGYSTFELAAGTKGRVYFDACVAGGRECLVRAVDPGGKPFTVLATTGARIRSTEFTREFLALHAGMCATSADTVLVASDAYMTVFEVSNGKGGPPGELADADTVLDDAALDGATLGSNTYVQRFGGDDVERALENVRKRRELWAAVEDKSRFGLYAILVLLLAGWGIDRFLAARDPGRGSLVTQMGERAQLIMDEIVKPDLGNLARYLLVVGGAFAFGAWLGWSLAGFGLAVMLAFGLSKSIGRRTAAPVLLQARPDHLAKRAFDIHLGKRAGRASILQADEKLEHAAYSMMDGNKAEERRHAAYEEWANLPPDPADLLDILSPPMEMLVATDRRIFRYDCDLVGRPRGLIEVYPRIAVTQQPAAHLCPRCGALVQGERRCEHQKLRKPLAYAASVLWPGAGHLVIGEFARARLLVMLAAALALAVAAQALPLVWGTLPITAGRVAAAVVPLVTLWAFALYDLRREIRQRDQYEVGSHVRKQRGELDVSIDGKVGQWAGVTACAVVSALIAAAGLAAAVMFVVMTEKQHRRHAALAKSFDDAHYR